MLKGFPPSNRIGPGKFAEIASAAPHQNYNNIALIGFTSKGPINTPTIVKDSRQLRTMFGLPHPDQRESNLLYAAEQCLLVGADVLIIRAADDSARVASVPIPGSDNMVRTHSPWHDPYVFHTNQFFRWKLDGVISNKTLVVLATDEEGISAAQLADELNDQLTPKDGIQFYVHEDRHLAVRTTLVSKNELELVSIQDAMYGPWGVTGFGAQMSPAEKVGVSDNGLYDLEFHDSLTLELVVTGSNNVTIDDVIQTVKLKGLEGKVNKVGDVVDYINNIELPLLPGGWRAFAAGNALGFRTKHAGRDASIVVKSGRVASKIFGFDSKPAFGKSPKNEAIFFGSKNQTEDVSITITADSPGVDGNGTKVVITNDHETDTFTIDVFNNGVQVESWGQLTKNKASRFYVESFINLVSEWVRVVDNANNSVSPKNGTYMLGDERIAGAVKGCDGIPADLTDQDRLLVGSAANKTGVYSLADTVYEVDMVAIPGRCSGTVVSSLLGVVERIGCMAIIDPPMGLSATDTLAWVKSYKSDVAAVFWPWVQIRDSHNRRNVWVPPSGSVMAAIARSDALSAPWHAATGQARGVVPGVLDVFNRPSQEEVKQLSGSVVNPITHYVGTDSFAVSSQKTLQGGIISTKRTLFYIEKRIRKAIHKLTGYDLSEEEFRGKVSQVCEYVLGQVKSGRGIYDYTIQMAEEMNASGVDKQKDFRARIGVQPREASGVCNLDFLFHRLGNSEKADTLQFDKGDR